MSATGTVGKLVSRIAVRLAMVVAVATAAGLASLPTSVEAAATGTTGYHERAAVDCNLMVGNTMLVHAPTMLAAPVTVPGNVVIIGDPHSQVVAYQATLLMWDGAKYARTTTQGRWIKSTVPMYMYNLVSPSYAEWNGSQWVGSQTGGATYFRDLAPGRYYRVSVQYHWYADSRVGSGDDVLDSLDYTYTQTFTLIHAPYCTY